MARFRVCGFSCTPFQHGTLSLGSAHSRRGLVEHVPSRTFLTCAFVALAMMWISCPGWAQSNVSDLDQVHISPRITPPKPEKSGIVDASLLTHTRPLRAETDLVLVPVTITDPMNRLVTGLDKSNFEVYEDKSQHERQYGQQD